VIFGTRLYWISVGDSPLFLFRSGQIERLNDDHSMAPELDEMLNQGLLSDDEALNHPDRNCLTSVLAGQDIPKIDCSGTPVELEAGDIIVAASDGLEFLSNEQIAETLSIYQTRPSAEISAALLRDIENLDDPDQDNVSLCLIKIMGETDALALRPMPLAEPATLVHSKSVDRPSTVTVLARKSGPASQVVCVSRKVKM
jgi:serine/threonine protein phosphatase PrpC